MMKLNYEKKKKLSSNGIVRHLYIIVREQQQNYQASSAVRKVQDHQWQYSIALIPHHILFEKIITPQCILLRTILRRHLAIMIE